MFTTVCVHHKNLTHTKESRIIVREMFIGTHKINGSKKKTIYFSVVLFCFHRRGGEPERGGFDILIKNVSRRKPRRFYPYICRRNIHELSTCNMCTLRDMGIFLNACRYQYKVFRRVRKMRRVNRQGRLTYICERIKKIYINLRSLYNNIYALRPELQWIASHVVI